MKALSTMFAGIPYRSRTEARWAVFFRFLHIRNIFEHEGFALEVDGKFTPYLPDFWLPPPFNVFLEVKPTFDQIQEQHRKYRVFNRDATLLVVCGLPRCDVHYKHGYVLLHYLDGKERPDLYLFATCRRCKKLSIVPKGWLNREKGGVPPVSGCNCINEGTTDFWDSGLLHASSVAMGHRFGERGAPNVAG